MATASSGRPTKQALPWWGGRPAGRYQRVNAERAVRIAVVGSGHLGRHHARILAGLPGADLVAVVDTNSERADATAAAVGVAATADFRELFGVSML